MSIVNYFNPNNPFKTDPITLPLGEERSEKLSLWTNPLTGTDHWSIQALKNKKIESMKMGSGPVPQEYLYLYKRFFLYESLSFQRWLPVDASIEFQIKGISSLDRPTIEATDILTVNANKRMGIVTATVAMTGLTLLAAMGPNS